MDTPTAVCGHMHISRRETPEPLDPSPAQSVDSRGLLAFATGCAGLPAWPHHNASTVGAVGAFFMVLQALDTLSLLSICCGCWRSRDSRLDRCIVAKPAFNRIHKKIPSGGCAVERAMAVKNSATTVQTALAPLPVRSGSPAPTHASTDMRTDLMVHIPASKAHRAHLGQSDGIALRDRSSARYGEHICAGTSA